MRKLRIGHGFDVHRLVAGRRLVVGGVEIPFEMGLEGHSDADVLLHAIMDSLLGAAGLPDIGVHFPPGDERYREADSAELLREVCGLLTQAGYGTIVNIDATIIAERPKMSPHIEAMRNRIAEVLRIAADRVNVKATTTEKIGFVGREEGMAAEAVCLISDE
jgi:2-C-methyl-D-erythritol 2,4-cyclodiphosphate synthase